MCVARRRLIGEISKDVTYFSHPVDRCICGCRSGACIPQREYQRQRTGPIPQRDLPEMILFSVNGKCGYPLKDTFAERYNGLDGRHSKLFVDLKSSNIALRFEVSLTGMRAGSDGDLEYCFSSCSRTRGGRGRWVQTPDFVVWRTVNQLVILDPNLESAEEPRGHYPREALYPCSKEDAYLFRGGLSSVAGCVIGMLIPLGFYQEVRDEVVDLSYQRYPGVIDLDHLELVGLKGGVCKHSYMAHFRLNSLSQ